MANRYFSGTHDGSANSHDVEIPVKQLVISNESASVDHTVTVDGEQYTIPANKALRLSGFETSTFTSNGASGDYKIWASDSEIPMELRDNTPTYAAVAAGTLGADTAGRAMMADDYFNAATAAAKFADDAIDNTFVQAHFAADAFGTDADSRAAFEAGFFNAATVDDLFASRSIGEDRIARELNGLTAADVADAASGSDIVAGQKLTYKVVIPNASTDLDFTIDGKCEIVGALAVKTGNTGGAGDQVILQDGATEIFTFDLNGKAHGAVASMMTVDGGGAGNVAPVVIADGGTIGIDPNSSTDCACILYIDVIRVA